jgi:ATP-dependent protease ClpP protease subunit
MNEEEELLLLNSNFVNIRRDEAMNRLSVHLRGNFPAPEEISTEIATLYALAEEYDSVIIFINSDGGQLKTLVELMSVFNLYKTKITVASGSVSSAGFILWGLGDIRVVQKYTSLMAHRESYSLYGKTDQQRDYVDHLDNLYNSMYSDLIGQLLTKEELEMAKRSEVFFTSNELIKRGVAMGWADFVERDLMEAETSAIMTIGNKTFMPIPDDDGNVTLAHVSLDIVDVYPYNYVMYHMDHSEEEDALDPKDLNFK